jgi:hypothetical protein
LSSLTTHEHSLQWLGFRIPLQAGANVIKTFLPLVIGLYYKTFHGRNLKNFVIS